MLTEALDDWELPNLQVGLDAALGANGLVGRDPRTHAGAQSGMTQFSLSDLMTDDAGSRTSATPSS